ncbi:MAG TPA: DUF1343 domain-containing protein [Polyangia bacterium]|jgi:Uncharacterized protein conserved in bacteria|nr:DUF1343 domain-containing protein [Polyangia bacterium]
MAVATGLDVLCAERLDLCRGRRVGVLCHPASVDALLVHVVDRLMAAGVRPVRLFGPEHGVRGEAQDMVSVEGERDGHTGLAVSSLYGQSLESLQPSQEALADTDVLLVDLQDVGSRYYTFIWTMALSMQAAARAGVAVVVLDRPNPIGGSAIEGGDVEADCESLVGLASLPVRHGLTIAEVARMVRAGIPWGGPRFASPLDLDLTVVPMRGWRRYDFFEATGLPWVMPSPNMPTVDSAFVYPGLCLVEGTNVSEGRGTTRPFEIIGAPFVDGFRLAERLAGHRLRGVLFRPLWFRPTFHKFAGQVCGGIQVHVTDRTVFEPYQCGVAILRELHEVGGESFRWRREPYEFVSDRLAIDLLTGSDVIRTGIEGGLSLAELEATWLPAQRRFTERRQSHLLYE